MTPPHANEASQRRLGAPNARAAAAAPHLVSVSERIWVVDGDGQARADAKVLQRRVTNREQLVEAGGRSFGAAVKRIVDILGAVVLALVFLPLIVTIVALMSRESGAVLYRHARIGRSGRVFRCLKFRTMVPDADQVLRQLLERHPELKAEWIRSHKLRDDPRVTRIGRFLRRTSLDELPQLWNVLRGDMSLVGPRPITGEELLRYGRNTAIYLSVKPGITGLWQVSGRNETDYRRRVVLDVYYVRKQNLLLDLYILLKTTRVVVAGDGAY